MKWLIIVVLVILFIYIKKKKLHIDWQSFFCKGFKKIDDCYGISSWDGKQGSGKSYSVAEFIRQNRNGKKVITNQKGYYENHKDFCIYESNIYDVISKFNNGVYDKEYIIFWDELFSMVTKGDLPQEIRVFISQLRKRHLILLTTMQEWLDTNISFRRYVKFSTNCSSRNILGSCWSKNVTISGYDLKWDNIANEYVAPVLSTTIRKCRKEVADSYDTDEIIGISNKRQNSSQKR